MLLCFQLIMDSLPLLPEMHVGPLPGPAVARKFFFPGLAGVLRPFPFGLQGEGIASSPEGGYQVVPFPSLFFFTFQ